MARWIPDFLVEATDFRKPPLKRVVPVSVPSIRNFAAFFGRCRGLPVALAIRTVLGADSPVGRPGVGRVHAALLFSLSLEGFQ